MELAYILSGKLLKLWEVTFVSSRVTASNLMCQQSSRLSLRFSAHFQKLSNPLNKLLISNNFNNLTNEIQPKCKNNQQKVFQEKIMINHFLSEKRQKVYYFLQVLV